MRGMAVLRCGALAVFAVLVTAVGAMGQRLEDYDYEDLAFRGIGFAAGPIWPTKVEQTVEYTVRVDLGFLGPGVRLVPSLSYWTSEMQRAELGELADKLNELGADLTAESLRPIDWSSVGLGLDAHYVWTVPGNLFTYLGLGLGIHVLNGSGRAIEETFVEDLLDSVTAGLAGVAGLEYAISERLRLFGEARFTALDDVQYPAVRLGGAVMVPGGGDTAVSDNEDGS